MRMSCFHIFCHSPTCWTVDSPFLSDLLMEGGAYEGAKSRESRNRAVRLLYIDTGLVLFICNIWFLNFSDFILVRFRYLDVV